MSIEVARNNAYAHLGEAWFRHQSTRILQRHLQYGQHCRLDLERLLAAAAGVSASRNLNNRTSNERFRQVCGHTAMRIRCHALYGHLPSA